MKRILLIHLLTLCTLVLSAQSLTLSAPQQVAAGQRFNIAFTVNTDNARDFKLGKLPEEFYLVYGPSTSQQSSYSVMNGKTTKSASITLTYVLMAEKTGTYTIPAATIVADGKTISSKPASVSVVDAPKGSSSGASSGASAGNRNSRAGTSASRRQTTGSDISGSDLFIRVSANKRKVTEQEPILLTYKVYTLVNLTQLDGKMPDLKGFHTQEIDLPQQKSFHIEQFNGRNYHTVTWRQYVVFPQQTGKLQIPSITFNGIVAVEDRSVDPWEAIFNGGAGYIEVKKQIVAPGVDIEVTPLSNKPSDFSGGVGRFNITASLDRQELKTNEPLKLQVTVSGQGNLKLLKEPIVEFPKDFDRYDAKMTDKTRLTVNGVEGSVVYEYLAVPRHVGDYDIPAVRFVYYDLDSHTYKTVSTQSFHVSVAKGEDGGPGVVADYTNKEDVALLAKDIRHIKLHHDSLRRSDEHFFGSAVYWCLLGAILVLFVLIAALTWRHMSHSADFTRRRASKAYKTAMRRLRDASRRRKSSADDFFAEVLKALFGYVADKFNIPAEDLSHDVIRQQLTDSGVAPETVDLYIRAISQCEFAQYASAAGDIDADALSRMAEEAIEGVEKR